MKRRFVTLNCWIAAAALGIAFPLPGQAKSYSSGGGGHSYSSSSSHSSSYGGGSRSSSSGSSRSFSGGSTRSSSSGGSSSGGSTKSFNSGSGKSYTSGSSSSGDRKGYSSTKSYSAGSGTKFSSGPSNGRSESSSTTVSKPASPSGSGFNFDSGAARARKEQASKSDFSRFKEAQNPSSTQPGSGSRPGGNGTYSGKPPPIIPSSDRSYRRTVYVPNITVIQTRPSRLYSVFSPYSYRPWVTYSDPYSSLFWWWLLDRSIDDQAWWAYHHRYDMDPARYQALLANNQQLEARVASLEGQQAPRDPSFTPTGLDRDLMYSDQYVNQAYRTRPTRGGSVAFWIFAVPAAIGACAFFIWLIWFKRWQPQTT